MFNYETVELAIIHYQGERRSDGILLEGGLVASRLIELSAAIRR